MAQQIRRRRQERACLIVEDSEVDQIRMCRLIEKTPYGLKPLIASTLEAARQLLMQEAPALILLDNNLPDGIGANFSQEVRRLPIYKDVPIVIVTDWPSPFMYEKAASARVSYILSKGDFDGRHIRAALMGQSDPALRSQMIS